MNNSHYNYAVIGGDLRQTYLIRELADTGSSTCHYALCQTPFGYDTAYKSKTTSLEEAIENSDTIICPIPLSKDGTFLNQNTDKENIPLNQILINLKSNQRFFAGSIPESFFLAAKEKGVNVFDFMKDLTLAQFNTLATAEGVICEAIKNSPMNLHHSKCAVLGYGKCGRTITDYLKGLFCHVTVATSPVAELAQSSLVADETLDLENFFKKIGEYDFIFNTIPSIILTAEILSRTKPAVTILDIASNPGGVDFAAAEKLGIKAFSCPGLPGKYAPQSSARAIKSSIERSILCL